MLHSILDPTSCLGCATEVPCPNLKGGLWDLKAEVGTFQDEGGLKSPEISEVRRGSLGISCEDYIV